MRRSTFSPSISSTRRSTPWVALPGLGHQDAAQVRVSFEVDAEEVEYFALEKIGRRPHRGHRLQARLLASQPDLQAQARFARDGKQVIDDFEARLRGIPVHAREIGEEVVLQLGMVTQDGAGFAERAPFDPHTQLVAVEPGAGDRRRLPGEEAGHLLPLLELLQVGDGWGHVCDLPPSPPRVYAGAGLPRSGVEGRAGAAAVAGRVRLTSDQSSAPFF